MIDRASRSWSWLLIPLLVISACDSTSPPPELESPDDDSGATSDHLPEWPVDLAAEWTVVEPEVAGVQSAYLGSAALNALRVERVKSLVVVKDGAIILEKYLHGAQSTDLFDVRSVTKSIVGTLVGIAVGQGYIDNLDTPIGDHLDWLMFELPEENRAVTFRHLLTMTGGWQANEWVENSYDDWIRSGDTERWILLQPRTHEPGERFRYHSASTHLLGVFLEQFLPGSMVEFADQKLFFPSGITQRTWEMTSTGFPNGGSGIDLTARDLARFGQLYLQDGMSGSNRVLPEGWVAQATTPVFDWRNPNGPLDATSYGYLWWTDDNGGDPIYYAQGYGGQLVFVKPSSKLVVVVTTDVAGVEDEPGGSSALFLKALRLIHDDVMPAVDRD